MKFRRWALFAALLASGPLAADTVSAVPTMDHHMHISSPASTRAIKLICDSYGPGACPHGTVQSTAEDAVRALDAAGIQRGVLMSTAYLFYSSRLNEPGFDRAQATRNENSWVIEQARLQCGRFSAAIGVNPLAPNAVDEIAYWASKPGVTGVKMHLTNSDVDFRAPEKVRKLAAVFQAAHKAHLPVMVHLSTGTESYGAADVAIFVRDVLSPVKGLPVQVLHAAGAGGIDSNLLSALGEFANAIVRQPEVTANLYFDLAEVVPGHYPDEGEYHKPSAQNLEALRALMRKIGLKRFLPASDWQQRLDLKNYYADLKEALGFSEDEWRKLMANEAPYLPAKSAEVCRH